LVCIPYAAAGSSAYRDWSSALPEWIEVVSIQLPGREARLREPSLRCARDVAAQLAPVVAEAAPGPLAVFGHSMGAAIAFELARRLAERVPEALAHLIVSGRGAPHIPVPTRKFQLDDDGLIAELASYGETPQVVLNDRALMLAMLPAIRADFEITEMYVSNGEPPLSLPMTVLAGTADPLVPTERIAPWASHTTAPCTIHWFEGGHFFIRQHQQAMVAIIRAVLAEPAGLARAAVE
jgi:surfactin synthase thioesterase subunit